MTTVHLVRHGAVDSDFDGICYGQRVDPPLGEPDVAAIERLRAALARAGVDLPVISSPARRARGTASLITGEYDVDPRWAERDFGTWEGRRWADCWSETPAEHLRSADAYVAFDPAGAESHALVVARVAAALDGIDEPSIVVTHAGVIRAALVIAGLSVTAAHAMFLPHLSVSSLIARERPVEDGGDESQRTWRMTNTTRAVSAKSANVSPGDGPCSSQWTLGTAIARESPP
jgi:broad specificity phosphatase PhoE